MDVPGDELLDDLKGEERAQRERLLARLADAGFEPDELARAVRERRLALLPVDRQLGGIHTAAEVEARTGLPAETLLRTRRLQGLPEPGPDERAFSDVDVEAARSARLFLDAGFRQERIDEITRVLGEGMARLAATITAAFGDTFLEAGDGEADVSARFAALAQQMTPANGPILIAAFRAHLRDAVARAMLGREELQSGEIAGTQRVAVCFADLVGFTRLGGRVDVEELGMVAGRLASLAASVTAPPVRLIKTIGDAAMLVSPEPAPLVAVALELVATFEREELPSLRAGIALGAATVHAGDYYGNSVNLASRVTGVARPGSVLCTREVRDGADGEFEWSAAGRHRLKGVDGPTPLYRARLRRAGPPDPRAAAPKPRTDPPGPRTDPLRRS